jgi:hypothetical protein
MKFKFLKTLFAVLVLSVSVFANAGLITTTFAGGNGQSGNMFDLTIANNSLLLTGMDVNISDTRHIEIYTRVGSYSGFENNAGAWNLMDAAFVIGNGNNIASIFDFNNFVLAANTTYGIYVTTTTDGMRYTNGSNSYSNSDLTLSAGIGKAYVSATDFSGSSYSPRTWNGTVRYDVLTSEPATSVPEPSTIAIFALGIMGLASRRFMKKA